MKLLLRISSHLTFRSTHVLQYLFYLYWPKLEKSKCSVEIRQLFWGSRGLRCIPISVLHLHLQLKEIKPLQSSFVLEELKNIITIIIWDALTAKEYSNKSQFPENWHLSLSDPILIVYAWIPWECILLQLLQLFSNQDPGLRAMQENLTLSLQLTQQFLNPIILRWIPKWIW